MITHVGCFPHDAKLTLEIRHGGEQRNCYPALAGEHPVSRGCYLSNNMGQSDIGHSSRHPGYHKTNSQHGNSCRPERLNQIVSQKDSGARGTDLRSEKRIRTYTNDSR